MSIRIAPVLVCGCLWVFAPAANAQTPLTVRIAGNTQWAKTITDSDGVNDQDPRADIISYTDEILDTAGGKMIVSFRVSQTLKAPGVAKLVVDDLTVTNSADNPITPAPASASILSVIGSPYSA